MSVGIDSEIEAHAVGFLGAALLDEFLIMERVSDGVVAFGGYEREALIGLSAFDVLHPDDLERAGEALLELTRTQAPTVDGMYRMKHADGTYHDYAVQAETVPHDGQVKTIFKMSAASPALRSEEFARDTVDTLRMLAESHALDDCLERVHRLIERHVRGTTLAISTIQDGLTRRHTRLADGTFRSELNDCPLPPTVANALNHHLQGPWRAFHRMADFQATPRGAVITSVLTDEDNTLLGYVEAMRDRASEPDGHEWMVHGLVRQVLTAVLLRVRLDAQLTHAADRDPLTGLANRRKLFNDIASHENTAGTTLLLIDLDDFSGINNNLGHHVGDQTLVALADRLRELCPSDATVSRFGGDEFVVWSPTDLSDLDDLLTALRSSNVVQAETPDCQASLRCSIGSITIRANESATDAIKRADEAMYVAKRAGGNRLHIG